MENIQFPENDLEEDLITIGNKSNMGGNIKETQFKSTINIGVEIEVIFNYFKEEKVASKNYDIDSFNNQSEVKKKIQEASSGIENENSCAKLIDLNSNFDLKKIHLHTNIQSSSPHCFF